MIVTGALMAVVTAAALFAVTVRNVLHAIFGLAVALVGIAGLFLVLNSPFVAAMEVLVYVGGISIAMVFAVMLSSVVTSSADGAGRRFLAALTSIGLFVALLLILRKSTFTLADPAPEPQWSVAAIGEDLLTHYNVVFELLSLVLLLAIIGAIVISRKTQDRPAPARSGDAAGDDA